MRKSFEMLQTGVGDLCEGEVQFSEIGQFTDAFKASVGDSRIEKGQRDEVV